MSRTEHDGTSSGSLESLGISRRLAWLTIGSLFLFGGLIALAQLVSGLVPALGEPAILTGMIGAISIGVVMIAVSRRAPSDHWLHLPIACGTAMIAVATLFSDHAVATAIAALYMLPAFVSSFVFRARMSVAQVALASALMTATFGSHQEQVISPRGISMLIVIVGGCAMIALARIQTLRAIGAFSRVAETDALTGVANVRGLRRRLAREIRVAEKAPVGGARITVFCVDLDNFKLVNDHLSHSAGDLVLAATARAMTGIASDDDFVARRGGDEFVLVATGERTHDSTVTANELAQAIRHGRRCVCPGDADGASVGFAHWRPGEDVDQLLERADLELRASKRISRSRRGAASPAAVDGPARPAARCDTADDRGKRSRRASYTLSPCQTKVSWRLAAMISGGAGIVIAGLGLSGLDPALRAPTPLSVALVAIAAAAVYAYLSTRRTSAAGLHIEQLASATLVVILVEWSGPVGPHFADAFIAIVLFAFLFFPPVQAAPYWLAGVVWYGSVLGRHDTEFAGAQLTVAVIAASVPAALLVIMRGRAGRFMELVRLETETDALTGIPNLRALRRVLAENAATPNRSRVTHTLINLDLDGFKRVNDVYGHAVGDSVLVAVAGAIAEVVGDEHYLARRGGDEFTLVARSISPDEIDRLTARVTAAVERERWRIAPAAHGSITIGRAIESPGEPIDLLIKRADIALHDAKVGYRAIAGDRRRAEADGRRVAGESDHYRLSA